jgi:hypothetical protein
MANRLQKTRRSIRARQLAQALPPSRRPSSAFALEALRSQGALERGRAGIRQCRQWGRPFDPDRPENIELKRRLMEVLHNAAKVRERLPFQQIFERLGEPDPVYRRALRILLAACAAGEIERHGSNHAAVFWIRT